MTPKRKRAASGRSYTQATGDTSGFVTRESLNEIGRRMASTVLDDRGDLDDIVVAVREEQARIEEARRLELEAQEKVKPVRRKRVDLRRGRDRRYSDSLDDFEMALLRHGINFDDLLKATKSYEMGTHTPYSKLAHAVLTWWCTMPIGGRRVVWVDPDSGYTENSLPKFSTMEGQDLLARGLAGAVWVNTRKQLLEARAWAKRMMSLTPAQRVDEPLQFGDERLTMR